MKVLNLTNLDHAVFKFIRPTAARINRSVAWIAECKMCGKKQLVGAAQVRSGGHARCIACQIPKEIESREIV